MNGFRIGAALGLSALALAGCATQKPVAVTRFHLPGPIARGQIVIEPLVPADKGTPEFATYSDIVAGELTRAGFTVSPALPASEQVAVFAVEYGTREGPRRGGLTLGIGGGSFGYRGGAGGGVAVPVGGGRGREIAATRLVVQIRRRSDHSTVWEGRAETSATAGTPAAQPVDAVRRLAAAIFTGFPGESGRTVQVK